MAAQKPTNFARSSEMASLNASSAPSFMAAQKPANTARSSEMPANSARSSELGSLNASSAPSFMAAQKPANTARSSELVDLKRLCVSGERDKFILASASRMPHYDSSHEYDLLLGYFTPVDNSCYHFHYCMPVVERDLLKLSPHHPHRDINWEISIEAFQTDGG
ncbi:hypothetical protein FOZ60_008098 [Perkinsus olseni]|uniref:Uncharacterized protein n=1 Tax=Perkinsus olseni TaxID=32597 RepID=A0A7J6NK59_PEROL|nr:hypothetical protein FOZ60_008098 [Perkinsus olseni]